MKILRDNKEVNGTVIYSVGGTPELVKVDGVFYDIKAFELVETKDQVKTKDVKKSEIKKK